MGFRMKKLFAALLCLVLLCAPAALAENWTPGQALTVIDCNEYITLREAPDSASGEITRIPLHGMVTLLEVTDDRFVKVGYGDQIGYARSRYLESSLQYYQEIAQAGLMYEISVESTIANHGDWESVIFTAYDGRGQELWTYGTSVDALTELELIDGFFAGTQGNPLFMVYNAEQGLVALDLLTGREKWSLGTEEVDLGGSICWAVSENGTLYIGGYYGPDPVAISLDGAVLWEAESGDDDLYWLNSITLTEQGVLASYESSDTAVLYSYQGRRIR